MSGDDTAEHAEPATVGSFATHGEAEVAQAKLSGYGIASVVVDVIEGGASRWRARTASRSRSAPATRETQPRSS